jgi:UDP-N-acetylmuramoylalanine--D-glutamate ligase
LLSYAQAVGELTKKYFTIAIAGSHGKSTTTALIGHVLVAKFGAQRVHVGGNIGQSPLLFLHKIKRGHVVVLEMSSWLLRDVHEPAFTVAVVTNLLRDHMNYYENMALYQRDKERIFLGQTSLDYAVLNRHDRRVCGMAKCTPAKLCWFTKRVVPGVKLLGEHNQFNIGAAWQVGKIFGLTDAALRSAVRSFVPLANRLEEVRRYRGRTFFNDTTATTPDATIAALTAFKQKVILIAGGNSKRLPLTALRRLVRQRVKYLLLLPGNANHEFPPGITVRSMRDAVWLAWELSQPGDIILLSPGVTWLPVMNEFERGRQFVAAARALVYK